MRLLLWGALAALFAISAHSEAVQTKEPVPTDATTETEQEKVAEDLEKKPRGQRKNFDKKRAHIWKNSERAAEDPRSAYAKEKLEVKQTRNRKHSKLDDENFNDAQKRFEEHAKSHAKNWQYNKRNGDKFSKSTGARKVGGWKRPTPVDINDL